MGIFPFGRFGVLDAVTLSRSRCVIVNEYHEAQLR